MEEIIKLLIKSNVGLLILGIGIGIVSIIFFGFHVIKWGKKFWGRVEGMSDQLIKIEAQTNGRTSMANTLVDHDKRICLNEQSMEVLKEDIKEIKTDVKQVFKILDSRYELKEVSDEKRKRLD